MAKKINPNPLNQFNLEKTNASRTISLVNFIGEPQTIYFKNGIVLNFTKVSDTKVNGITIIFAKLIKLNSLVTNTPSKVPNNENIIDKMVSPNVATKYQNKLNDRPLQNIKQINNGILIITAVIEVHKTLPSNISLELRGDVNNSSIVCVMLDEKNVE